MRNKKDLTFPIARHTFATTDTLSNDVLLESVSKMLGHRSIRTTQHYAKILDWMASHDMGTLRSNTIQNWKWVLKRNPVRKKQFSLPAIK